ncbi:MAG: Ldh family oxidoreductase [Pseudomonadota bacterium]
MSATSAPTAPLHAPQELRDLVIRVFQRLGARTEDAATIADLLVWSHLTGRDGHGLVRVPAYARMARSGEMDVRAVPAIVRALPATLLVDGGAAPGAVAMMAATGWAVERAKANGGCFALVRRTTHTGAIGYYALKAAEAGLAALVIGSGKPIMAYHGARVPSVSTSPIALAVPGGAGGPLLLDMAASVAALGRLRQLAARDAEIPEGWALDADGRPTRRAQEAVIPLPLGGPKGSGLALMFEAMTSVLAGAPVVAPSLADPGGPGRGSSAMLMLMDVAAFSEPETFVGEVETLRAAMKALPRQEGFDDIFLPGERSRALADQRAREGIPVPAALMAEVRALAEDA